MLPRFLPILAPLSLLFPLSHCGSLVSPDVSAGTYVLEEVNGNPLPAVSTAHEFGITEIVADTLWLELDGTGIRHVTYRSSDAGGEPKTYRSEDPFTYTLLGERIELAFACRDVVLRSGSVPMASCIAPPHFVGRVEPGALRGEGLHQNQLRYRRLMGHR